MLDANFWQDKTNSKKILKEKKLFEDLTNSFEESIKKLNDLNDLYQLAVDENNQSIIVLLRPIQNINKGDLNG